MLRQIEVLLSKPDRIRPTFQSSGPSDDLKVLHNRCHGRSLFLLYLLASSHPSPQHPQATVEPLLKKRTCEKADWFNDLETSPASFSTPPRVTVRAVRSKFLSSNGKRFLQGWADPSLLCEAD